MAKEGKIIAVIHEQTDSQHRIVFIHEDSTNTVGEWVELRQIAALKGHFAVVGESPLPQGIFTCRGVDHQVLG